MSKISIVNRFTGVVIVEGEYNDIKSLIENNQLTNLQEANLLRADLQEANLLGADLQEANLQEANLLRADLQEADLRGADLRGANLQEANLLRADLRGADLRGADLRGANLQEANLLGADLQEANLDFSSWPLWCGSLKVITDDKIKAQLLYHVISVIGVDKFTDEQLDFANTFHRVGEVPKLTR